MISLLHPQATLDDAYAIQREWVRVKQAGGRQIIGWKIGLTSKAMQYALGIDTPDSGVLFDDMLFEDGATIPPDRFIQPRIEAELAFVFRENIEGASLSMHDVLAATDYVVPALEILDTRVKRKDPESGIPRTIIDTVSDNAANAGIVLGNTRIRPDDVDLRWVGAIVSRNAVVEETGLGAGVLSHPARGIAWLAMRLHQYGGRIEAGQIILSGSFIRPVEARQGDTIMADYGRYGTISCFFERNA
ncbi:2-oxo-hept-4-ene-1,7-dioate hydratase [Asaia prunellae]|uniref:2-oxo-hept-4-ene-1,7-dioate hydratase n=1 Tax=Asaia prunellae TaxID=610245 RepID=UPI000A933AA9|nr:2-oxo-hepta-3-ene-1,7-dioic acid hydratase [Asaia prunellae]